MDKSFKHDDKSFSPSSSGILKKKPVPQVNEEEIKHQACNKLCSLITMTGGADDGSSLDIHANIHAGEGGSAPVNSLTFGLHFSVTHQR